MKVSFRQGILRHQTDTNNNPLFLQKNGQTVNLYVSPDPTIFTATFGMAEYLVTEPTTIISAWAGPFPVGTDYWLYWDISLTTGIRTFGHTIYEPIEQSQPPTGPLIDQHWFDTINRKMKVWNSASWVEKVRVFSAKYTNGTLFQSMSALTPDFRGTQVGLAFPYFSGGIAFDNAGKPIRNSNNTFFTTEDLFTAGVPSGSSIKVNTIILNAAAQEPLAAFQVVMLTDYNEILHADPFQQGVNVFGMIEEDAVTSENVRVVTEGMLTNDQWDWPAAGADINAFLYCDLTGGLSLTPVLANQIPVGQVVDKQTILFRPMVLVDDGSSSGGTDDHSLLNNLDVDDHPQYFNQSRLIAAAGANITIGGSPFTIDVAGGSGSGLDADLWDGQDSNIILPQDGDVMIYLSGEWINTPLPPTPTVPGAGTNITIGGSPETINVSPQGPASGLDADLWDGEQSNISSPANGEVLTYNAGNWENQALPTDNEGITTVQDEGGAVAGAPHDTINFVGAGVVATDGTSGVVTVTIAGGGGGATTRIEDTDTDTYIDVESTPDADIIVMALGTAPNNVADDYISATAVTLGRASLDFNALNAGIVSPGGDINITGGDTAAAYFTAGNVNITAGTNTNAGDGYGGDVNITGGNADNNYGYTGDVNITGGSNVSTSGFTDGGDVNITGGNTSASYGFPGPGGVNISAGTDDTGTFSGYINIINQSVTTGGGDVNIQASDAASGSGGSVDMSAGDGLVGGRVVIAGGVSSNTSSPIAGDVTIQGGGVVSGFAGGGEVRIFTGSSNDAGQGGKFTVDCGSGATFGGDILLEAGTGFSARGGYARIEGGNATNHNGGLVDLRGGNTSSDNLAHFGGIVTVEGGSSYFGYGRGGDIVLLSGEGPGPSQTQPGTYGAGNIELVVRGNVLADHGVVQIKSTNADFLPLHNPELQLFSNSLTNHVTIQAPTALASDTQFTLPPDNGTVDYVLRTDGSGVTTWVAAAGGGGGSTSRIEDADGDTFVDTEVGANDNEVTISLGQDVSGRTAGPVAQFTQGSTIIRGLDSAINGHAGSVRLIGGENTYPSSNTREGGFISLTGGDSDLADGGDIHINAGDSSGIVSSADGGNVGISAGDGNVGDGGGIGIYAGSGDERAGGINIIGGNTYYGNASSYNDGGFVWVSSGSSGYQDSGYVVIQTAYKGYGQDNTNTGNIDIRTGNNNMYSNVGNSGDVSITTGYVYHGNYAGANASGDILIKSGNVTSSSNTGTVGAINLTGGDATFAGDQGGNIVITPGASAAGPAGVAIIDGTTMPQDTPAVGELLQTDASGVTTWEAVQYIHTGASLTSHVVAHNLGQRWCSVQVYDSSTGVSIVPTSVTLTDANNCTVLLGAAAAVKIVVVGVPGVV